MNDKQRAEIVELRKQGLDYKKIAQVLELNLNTVKSYCRNHKLKIEDLTSIYCKNCNVLLLQKPKQKKMIFCSDCCRQKWWNEHRYKSNIKNKTIIICKTCALSFHAYPHEKRKYCSHQYYINNRFRGDC